MGRRYGQILGVTIVTSLLCVQHRSQRAAAADPPAQSTVQSSAYQSLLTESSGGGYVRFYWCGGHLRLDPPKYRKGSANLSTASVKEKLTVSASDGLPSAMYRLNQQTAAGTRTIKMDVTAAETIEIEIVEPSDVRLEIYQSPLGDITVTMTNGTETLQCTGATWLHLYAEHGETLPPVLWRFIDRLVPGKPIDQFAREVEQKVRGQQDQSRRSRAEVLALVDKLRSPRRSDRASATAALLRMGSVAAMHLSAISQTNLDAEQIAAIQSISRRVQPARADYAGSLAARLAGDQHYRQILAANPSFESPKPSL